jgi:hypothetical protein
LAEYAILDNLILLQTNKSIDMPTRNVVLTEQQAAVAACDLSDYSHYQDEKPRGALLANICAPRDHRHTGNTWLGQRCRV